MVFSKLIKLISIEYIPPMLGSFLVGFIFTINTVIFKDLFLGILSVIFLI